ncbi:IclR family transcriptional regulator [Aquabacter spiritensis]|uniref:IclR family transcriptional regulator n=1 Tax=Aquabacter spiritensis TaxID=933073 RepID=A0A4R3LJZ3_9HYPH|nr:IclR family transcriptional regulator [Aquabacter spiritensis]TCT00592.1 IclR family transcriptional regulator [Aquabacter spiritensis]
MGGFVNSLATLPEQPDEDSPAIDQRQFVNSLGKGIAVLEAFSSHPGAMSLQEIADLAGLDKSTVQRMAYTLLQLGYLRKGLDGRGFCLGTKVLDRAFDFLRSWPLIERATPVLNELQLGSHERVDLSIFDDLTICYAIRRQSKRQTFYATLVGRRIPTFCSSGGRAIMARLSDGEVDSILRRSDLIALTPKTLTDPDAIREEVQRARREGFSLVHDESLIGEVAVACAVLDHRARPVAAVHIAGSLSEWSPESFAKRFSPLAAEAAGALSGAIAPF